MHILVLGGIRSGKSLLAEQAAARLGQAEGLPVSYVATARSSDAEMAERIRRHRLRRPANWRTIEAGGDPDALPQAVEALRGDGSILLLDCLSLWVAAATDPKAQEELFSQRLERLLAAVAQVPHAIVVSVEAGLGLVPLEPLSRLFLDSLGDANQAFARTSERVVLAVAGLPWALKGDGLP